LNIIKFINKVVDLYTELISPMIFELDADLNGGRSIEHRA